MLDKIKDLDSWYVAIVYEDEGVGNYYMNGKYYSERAAIGSTEVGVKRGLTRYAKDKNFTKGYICFCTKDNPSGNRYAEWDNGEWLKD